MSVTAVEKITKIPGFHEPRTIGPAESFTISALAPAIAVIFTNPFDTAKVRLQLQGQMKEKKIYKNSFDAIYKIAKTEGMRGLQKGLTPAILREGSKNFFRIGMFDPIMSVLHDKSQGRAPGWKRMLAGSLCGVMGALACNPFELIKTRLQSASHLPNAVGHQHGYTGVMSGLYRIYSQEGFLGLYRGSVLSMGRSIVGSGTNLASYSLMKEALITDYGWKDSVWLDMIAGLASGAVSCVFMNPIDVVRTRFYNQPYLNGKGQLYTSGIDAISKIVKHEGLTAFYKGFLTHFLRIGPHFCLTFVFLGILRRGVSKVYCHLDDVESFREFDLDGNGKLDRQEIQLILERVMRKNDSTIMKQYLDRLLMQADHDHDQMISFEEFGELENELRRIVKESQ